ncbi:MBL fold metallo-hydrolase [Roseateles sp. BYS96W]|uniref:MBL fold metallo-hydrolase n=1 Tax=Pelomonas nitida TaxID=3299027 RepID=A0ABW7GCW0_9BURK
MKRSLVTALVVFAALLAGGCAYLTPTLGQIPKGERLAEVERSPQHRDGVFQNEVASPPRPGGLAFAMAVIRGRFAPKDRPTPPVALPTVKTDLKALPAGEDIVVWLGHSSYYVQVGGKRLLVDPVFSDYAAPLPWMVKAFDGTTIYSVDDIPDVDAVLISHDHYDHLDYASMKALLNKTRVVIAGLGNGAHLAHWGYPAEKIREADWYTKLEIAEGLTIHVLPAQHYSGRFMDRNKALWASYAVETAQRRLYFSGDTGFGPHFERIAQRFERFDLVALDSGQYNKEWADIHMNPEEASKAAEILRTRDLLTAHAGRFSLARHAWDEPFERAAAASAGKPYRLLTPRIGELVYLDGREQQFSRWWVGLE